MTQDQQLPVSALIEGLRRAAVATYGEERTAEAPFQAVLETAIANVRRVLQEPLQPSDPEPYRA
jgi:hypothetical protein